LFKREKKRNSDWLFFILPKITKLEFAVSLLYIYIFLLFSFFVISSAFLELSVDGVELKCDYDSDGGEDRCRIVSADLSLKTIGTNYIFSATQEQKRNTARILFYNIGRVAHLPRNLFKEFQNLKKLDIWFSEIPILRNNFFNPEHNKFNELVLRNNRIKMIEENAFAKLKNLESISLINNDIKTLPAKLFLNNHKLKGINLSRNEIKRIHPGTFKNLNLLEQVDLRWNECFDQKIGCLDWWCTNLTELDRSLQPCYENYTKNFNLLKEGENM
jgi:Leucine-rich repeat (LRR) protein